MSRRDVVAKAFEGKVDDEAVDVVHEVVADDAKIPMFSFRTLLSYTGPGFLMCIAYLDPGNLEADLQVGAYCGYSLLWVLFVATAMGLVLQCMAAKLGVVTGKNLARVCRDHYSRRTSIALWLMTELAIIGSDLQEIIGSAIAFKVLFGLPLWAGCLITFGDTFTFLGIHYFGVRKLEAVFVALVSIMTICFFINFGKAPPPTAGIMEGFAPTIKSYGVQSAVGLIGAVIMPHNIYLHSALVLSRKVDRENPRMVREANKYFAIDSAIALFISFLINLAVVSVFSFHFFDPVCANVPGGPLACLPAALFNGTASGGVKCDLPGRGIAGSGVCDTIGLAQAHFALKDALGPASRYIWGVGLLAAGQSSTMTGTYAGQYVMEGFLDLKVPVWVRVTFTRLVAIGPGIVVAILTQNDQNLSDKFQEWVNVLQSVILTFALLPVLHFTSNPAIMGKYVNGPGLTSSIWLLALAVLSINIYLVTLEMGPGMSPIYYVLFAFGGVIYMWFSYSLMSEDIARFIEFIRAKWSRSQRRASVHGASGGPNDSRDGDLRAHLLVTEIGLAPSSAQAMDRSAIN